MGLVLIRLILESICPSHQASFCGNIFPFFNEHFAGFLQINLFLCRCQWVVYDLQFEL